MIEDKFNLNSVSLTGEEERQPNGGLYTFEGQEYKRGLVYLEDNLDFIDIGQRERKQVLSYDIDKYYRETLLKKESGQP